MFAQQFFRPATVLSKGIRQYASSSGAASGGSRFFKFSVYTVGGATIAALAFDDIRLRYLTAGMREFIAVQIDKQNQNPPNYPKVFTGGDQGFVPLELEEIRDVNYNTKVFRFKFDKPDAISGLTYCSALLTKFQNSGQDKPVVRPYTPVSEESLLGHLDLMVKQYPGGPMSSHIHNLKVGDKLEFKGPLPKYPWSPNKHEHVALVAGGTGITPMIQLCRAILGDKDDKTKITLIFGNRTEEDIIMREVFDGYAAEYPGRFKAYHVLESPPKLWRDGKGFISKETLAGILPDPSRGEKIKIFVCGPPGLYKSISGPKKSPADQGELDGYLKELGYSKDQVYKF